MSLRKPAKTVASPSLKRTSEPVQAAQAFGALKWSLQRAVNRGTPQVSWEEDHCGLHTRLLDSPVFPSSP